MREEAREYRNIILREKREGRIAKKKAEKEGKTSVDKKD